MRFVTLLLACPLILMKAQETTIHIPLVMGVDEVTFDATRLSPAEVKHWMQLSPNVGQDNGYLTPENIELCDSNDPRYEGCGKEQEHVNFHNAQLNIDRIRKRIGNLDPNRYPPDMSSVVLYVRRIQSFGLWRDTQLLAFEKSGDLSVLESQFDGINPKVSCSKVLDRIRNAEGHAEASHLGRFDWFNCVWHAESKQIGEYPKSAWEKFLSAHGIREHYIEEKVED